jgi:(S)-citramalyl-CoA lyase
MSPRRCMLFVPGNRPERFEKAFASGADMVCIDWEDATPVEQKADARAATMAFLQQRTANATEAMVRINRISSTDGLRDLLCLADAKLSQPPLVMIAKTESARDVQIAREILPAEFQLLALLESPAAIESAFEIARTPVIALMLGGADYCAELGVALNGEALHYARSRLAAAAASQSLLAIDVPFLGTGADADTQAELSAETSASQLLGMHCKSAIHPNQVQAIQRALSPTAAAIADAQKLLAAFKADGTGAMRLDGKLVDRPVVLAAENVLRRAGM